MKKDRRIRSGFLVADALTGLFLVVALAAALAAAMSAQKRGATRLAGEREALRAAERTLVDLQAGKPAPPSTEDLKIEVRGLGEAPAPAGKRWVRVSANVRGRTAELIGLVPKDAVP